MQIAAELCHASNLAGYSDWFLPSKDELLEIYHNKTVINNSGGLWDILNDDWYWSSSEFTDIEAYRINLLDGSIHDNTSKNNHYNVRAIRAFSAPINLDTTNNIIVSTSGWNYITVTDSLGCTATDSIYVQINNCGCTDPTAYNYDPAANEDDGSCVATVYGCMDSTAIFYDVNANTDDGSCIYCDIQISQLVVSSNTPGQCNGFALFQASSSYPPISYNWSDGSTGSFN